MSNPNPSSLSSPNPSSLSSPNPYIPTAPKALFPVDDSPSVIMQPANVSDFQDRPKRRVGRPRTKVQPFDITHPFGGGNADSPPGPQVPRSPGPIPGSPTEKQQEAAAKARADKKDREIKDLQGKIVKDFNEQLMEGLITLGIPEAFLYKNPSSRPLAVDSRFTPIGQAICINPMQANWISHGIIEAKEFPAIQKLSLGKSDGPSYLWLALGGLGLLSYLQGLFTAVTQMQKLMKELKEIQGMQSAEDLREPPVMNFQEGAAEGFQG